MAAMPHIDRISQAIIAHYASHARVLPWRKPPGHGNAHPDPYQVWLSEVMLQQTTVAAVIPYFNCFTSRWPDIAALAAAEPDAVMTAWAGLGYYSRARHLIACARSIVDEHDGQFPEDVANLIRLPGIGPYTAAAINAFAFGGDAIPIDANVERVIARIFNIATPLPQAKREITEAARTLWPPQNGGDFAQALMDLGAGPCAARRPRCTACPISRWCGAANAGTVDRVPVKAAKRPRPERFGRVWWIERGSGASAQVRLVRRPASGLLGGMRALPGTGWDTSSSGPPEATVVGSVRHIFTHFALTLTVERHSDLPRLPGGHQPCAADGEWWPISRLDEAGLPALYRKAADIVLKERALCER